MYEAKALLDFEYYSHKDGWEQARMIAWMIAQVNSKKQLHTDDITKFYWEKGETIEKKKKITKEDVERLKNKAQEYLKKINGRNSN